MLSETSSARKQRGSVPDTVEAAMAFLDTRLRRDQASQRKQTSLPGRQKVVMESLENRLLLSVVPEFVGPVGLSAGTIVNISQANGNQTEGTIAVNPTSPNQVFAISNPGTSAGQSTNGGSTFTTFDPSNQAGFPACCDNVAVFDEFGNAFYVDLNNTVNSVDLFLSTAGGAAGTFNRIAQIDTGTVDQPSMAVGHGSVWVTWNDNGTIKARGAAVTGLGLVGAFNAEQSAPDSDSVGGQFGDIAVNPVTGAVVVTYQSDTQIFTNTDADGLGAGGFAAQVFVTNTNVDKFDAITPQPQRTVDAEANLAYGPDGRLYMAYTDEIIDESNNTDIFVRHSTDNGATWSAAVRVNDDAGTNSQFLPEIAVDPTTGFVALGWYDARLDTGQNDGINDTDGVANNEANFFAALSTDGGLTFGQNLQ